MLRFEPEAADDAAGWLFHPSQSIEREPDGALTVRFRAGGVQEMRWHLFTWGTAVTVVAPDLLRVELAEMMLRPPLFDGTRLRTTSTARALSENGLWLKCLPVI
jgi:WYL domain